MDVHQDQVVSNRAGGSHGLHAVFRRIDLRARLRQDGSGAGDCEAPTAFVGRTMVKTLPAPGALITLISPPICFATLLRMASSNRFPAGRPKDLMANVTSFVTGLRR